MDIFLLRHGAAEPYADQDRNRQLTQAGQTQVKLLVENCAPLLTSINSVVISPYVRAQQTFQIVEPFLPALQPDCKITQPFLEPDGIAGDVLHWLHLNSQKTHLLVTHQPLIGSLVNGLCGSDPGYHHLAPGTLACIKMDVFAWGLGDLQWLRSI